MILKFRSITEDGFENLSQESLDSYRDHRSRTGEVQERLRHHFRAAMQGREYHPPRRGLGSRVVKLAKGRGKALLARLRHAPRTPGGPPGAST